MPNNMIKRGSQGTQSQTKAEKPVFKTTPKGDVIATSLLSLGKLTVDPQMRAALTNASAKLVIEIDAGGTVVFLADKRSGNVLGGPEDLQKMNGIRAFITRERKESSALEISTRLKNVAYLASVHVSGEKEDFTQPPLDSSFIAGLKPILSSLEVLQKTEEKIRANKNATNREVVEEYLLNQIDRTKRAYLDFIEALVEGLDTKGLLNRRLLENGVSSYMHTKLINRSLVIDFTQDLNRVVFPADPSKGLCFTLEEWRNNGFVTAQGRILARSTSVLNLARSDSLIRAICQFPQELDLEDRENSQVISALKGRLFAFPHLEDLRYLTSAGGKAKTNGWKFPIVSMAVPNGAVTALGLAILRTYCANLQMVELVDDYYRVVAPGSVSRADVTPQNNFYVQWEKALDDEGHCAAHAAIIGGNGTTEQRRQFVDWIAIELRLAKNGSARRALYRAIGLTDEGGAVGTGATAAPRQIAAAPTAAPRRVEIATTENFTAPLGAVDSAKAQAWANRTFPQRVGKSVRPRGEAALTRLTERSKTLLGMVQRLSPFVANSLASWLRGFNSERLQDAAATLALAKFDELFIDEQIDDTDSHAGYGEGMDWADEVNSAAE